jgi:hypothetical protein
MPRKKDFFTGHAKNKFLIKIVSNLNTIYTICFMITFTFRPSLKKTCTHERMLKIVSHDTIENT